MAYDLRLRRVSTDGQSVDAQVRQLRNAGARQVFRDTTSGILADFGASVGDAELRFPIDCEVLERRPKGA